MAFGFDKKKVWLIIISNNSKILLSKRFEGNSIKDENDKKKLNALLGYFINSKVKGATLPPNFFDERSVVLSAVKDETNNSSIILLSDSCKSLDCIKLLNKFLIPFQKNKEEWWKDKDNLIWIKQQLRVKELI